MSLRFKLRENGLRDYGDLSAVDPPFRRRMYCDPCNTTWLGCWDNFQCPECGEGVLPEPPTTDDKWGEP